MKRTQSGMTLIGFVIVLAVVGVVRLHGHEADPDVLRVLRGQAGAERPGQPSRASPTRIRPRSRTCSSAGCTSATPTTSSRSTSRSSARTPAGMMTVDYEVRKPLIANLDVVGKFHAEKDLRRGGRLIDAIASAHRFARAGPARAGADPPQRRRAAQRAPRVPRRRAGQPVRRRGAVRALAAGRRRRADPRPRRAGARIRAGAASRATLDLGAQLDARARAK